MKTISGSAPQVFEETARVAIAAAHRRRLTLWIFLASLFCAVALFLVNNGIKSRREREQIKEFLAIGNTMHDEWDAFEAKSKAAKDQQDFLARSQPDHSASAARYATFAEKYPSSPLAWVAAFRAGSDLINKKEWARAKTVLEPVLRYTRKHDLIQVRVRRVLAGIQGQLGDFKGAIENIDQAIQTPAAPGVEQLKLFRAQLLYLAGQKKEAAQALGELKNPAQNPENFLQQDPFSKAPGTEAALWASYWDLNDGHDLK